MDKRCCLPPQKTTLEPTRWYILHIAYHLSKRSILIKTANFKPAVSPSILNLSPQNSPANLFFHRPPR